MGITSWKFFGSAPLQANAGRRNKAIRAIFGGDPGSPDPERLGHYLNSLEEPVVLWDGKSLTGEALAQFLLAEQIPVVWGSDGDVRGQLVQPAVLR